MSTVTKQEFDTLAAQVKDVADLVKKGQTEHQEQIEQIVKSALSNHPGFTPERKVQFSETKVFGPEMVQKDILASMPKEVQAEMDNVFILSKMLGTNPRNLKSWGRFARMGGDFIKALDSATVAAGKEWIPTDFSNQLYELVRVSGKVVPLFPAITMPSSPYTVPVQIGRLNTFKHAEQTADTSQTKIPVGDVNNLSGALTFTAQGHGTRVLTSKELEEDSIIPILPFLQQEIVRALAEGREDAVLNGDTTATHQDGDVTDAGDRRKLWSGLRKLAIANSLKTDLSTFNTANLRALRASLGRYSVNPNDLAWVVGISDYMKLMGLAEVITVDKYGPNATILAGELAKFDGIPVIVSEWIRQDLNASGVYDNVTKTKTVIHLVHRNGYAFGNRRQGSIQLLRELYAESDQDCLLIKERVDFEPIYPVATNSTTAMGYNITA